MDAAGEEVAMSLPDDLLENIISRFPFPYILKARMLNRTWRSKFEGVARCSEWPTYCPTFITSNYLLGYDRVKDNWIRMGLKGDHVLRIELDWTQRIRETRRVVEGVLFCGNDSITRSITIINLLTGSRRTIPYSHVIDHDFLEYSLDLAVSRELDEYQVVLYATDLHNHRLQRMLYDSSSRTWSSRSVRVGLANVNRPFFGYSDGNMYYAQSQGANTPPVFVIQANFENGFVRKSAIPHDFYDRTWSWKRSRCPFRTGVLRCGLRIIVFIMSLWSTRTMVHLYEVHSQSINLAVIKLSESPLRDFTEGDFEFRDLPGVHPSGVVSNRDSIYFYGRFYLTSYDLESNLWSSHRIQFEKGYREASHRLRICPVSFDPRVNPFVKP